MLIVFTRYPEPGTTKTRLIPALGAEGAAALQREMAEHVVHRAKAVGDAPVEIRFEGGDEPRMRDWLGEGIGYRPQGEGDLGQRMARAFREAFEAGCERVVVIGSDCPGVTPELLAEALDALAGHDLVLGPAADGGYYLIGLRRPVPELFDGLPWGTDAVCARTLEIAEGLALDTVVLPVLADVDRPDDLPVWEAERETPRLSVVIPTLDEGAWIERALQGLGHVAGVEVLVVDGGSADDTVAKARALGARVVIAEPGRAMQQNRGAEAARGDLLLFLHADTLVPDGYLAIIEGTLGEPGVVAGAFALKVDSGRRGLRLIERAGGWRSRRLQLPYGDQGIFLRAETFRTVGGFPELPIMEDYELSRRLRRLGRVVTTPEHSLTSGRRWEALGVVRTVFLNQLVVAGYRLGVSPARLARWYDRSRGVAGPSPRA